MSPSSTGGQGAPPPSRRRRRSRPWLAFATLVSLVMCCAKPVADAFVSPQARVARLSALGQTNGLPSAAGVTSHRFRSSTAQQQQRSVERANRCVCSERIQPRIFDCVHTLCWGPLLERGWQRSEQGRRWLSCRIFVDRSFAARPLIHFRFFSISTRRRVSKTNINYPRIGGLTTTLHMGIQIAPVGVGVLCIEHMWTQKRQAKQKGGVTN